MGLDDYFNQGLGWIDRVTTGAQNVIKGYYDTAFQFKNGEQEAQYRAMQENGQAVLDEWQTDSPAANWSGEETSKYLGDRPSFDFASPQNLLIAGAIGLIVYAVAKG